LRRYKRALKYILDRRQNYTQQQHQRIIYLRDQRTLKFTKNTTKTNIEASDNTVKVKHFFTVDDLKALDMQQRKIYAEESIETLCKNLILLKIYQALTSSGSSRPHTGCLKKSSPPKKPFWNIFTSIKSFYVKFCKFVGNSYPHMSANFCTFILIFHQMALIFP